MARHLDTALFREARNAGGSVERVRESIADGAKVNGRHHCGNTPLCVSASRGRIELVTILLVAEADPNLYQDDGSGPLHWAANNGHLSVVEQLLGIGADPNAMRDSGQSVLVAAISNGHAEIVRRLIEAGAAVDHRYYGHTMPEHAEWCGQRRSPSCSGGFAGGGEPDSRARRDAATILESVSGGREKWRPVR